MSDKCSKEKSLRQTATFVIAMTLSCLLAVSVAVAQSTDKPSPQQTAAEKKYSAAVRERIERYWQILPGLDKSHYSRDTVVWLAIGKTGELLNANVSESSGSELLDSMALRAVRRAAPYPKLPRALGRETMDIRVRFQAYAH
ncbi:MAG: TonB family protein [Pseudomonadota bacterium]